MAKNILVLPGDYIGPEIMAEAVKVLEEVNVGFELDLELEYGLLGGAALDVHGVPLPDETLASAREVDAILLGAVGGPKWDDVERHLRPERACWAFVRNCSCLATCARRFFTRSWQTLPV